MSCIELGSYVVHAQLPELGTGEVLLADDGDMRIRFASGERTFAEAFVAPHLSITTIAPMPASLARLLARRRVEEV